MKNNRSVIQPLVIAGALAVISGCSSVPTNPSEFTLRYKSNFDDYNLVEDTTYKHSPAMQLTSLAANTRAIKANDLDRYADGFIMLLFERLKYSWQRL